MKETLSKKVIGIRLRTLRLKYGISQKSISVVLDVSRSNYSQVELGNQYPTYDALTKLSKYYNKSYEWLLHGRDSTRSDSGEEPVKLNRKSADMSVSDSGISTKVSRIIDDIGFHINKADTILYELRNEIEKLKSEPESVV